MGYHKRNIPKGELGEFSKIREEFEELNDAVIQGSPILELCECADLIGAIEAYVERYNVSIQDVIHMMNLTKKAFKEGER